MLKQFEESTNEIYQEGILKVPVLNRSTKGATTAPFLEHPVHSVLSAESKQNEILKQFEVSTNEGYEEGFLKVPVLNRSTKGAMISSFRRAPCL